MKEKIILPIEQRTAHGLAPRSATTVTNNSRAWRYARHAEWQDTATKNAKELIGMNISLTVIFSHKSNRWHLCSRGSWTGPKRLQNTAKNYYRRFNKTFLFLETWESEMTEAQTYWCYAVCTKIIEHITTDAWLEKQMEKNHTANTNHNLKLLVGINHSGSAQLSRTIGYATTNYTLAVNKIAFGNASL